MIYCNPSLELAQFMRADIGRKMELKVLTLRIRAQYHSAFQQTKRRCISKQCFETERLYMEALEALLQIGWPITQAQVLLKLWMKVPRGMAGKTLAQGDGLPSNTVVPF